MDDQRFSIGATSPEPIELGKCVAGKGWRGTCLLSLGGEELPNAEERRGEKTEEERGEGTRNRKMAASDQPDARTSPQRVPTHPHRKRQEERGGGGERRREGRRGGEEKAQGEEEQCSTCDMRARSIGR